MWPFSRKKTNKNNSSDIDNVQINRDGIVSLNLENEQVREKVFKQIDKLKALDDKLNIVSR